MIALIFLSFLCTQAFGWLWYPEQLHLAWTENENEMSVTFVTQWPIYFVSSYAHYRPFLCTTDRSDYSFKSVEASVTKFDAGQDEGTRYIYIYEARMSGLEKDCQYEYYVGSLFGSSDFFYFNGLTPDYNKPYKTLNETHSVLIYGDWGTGPNGMGTKEYLANITRGHNFDAVLHIGDFAYDLHSDNGTVGDAWFREAEEIAGFYPYMTNPGNHEDHMNFTAYKARFNMPVTEENQGTDLFFSFNLGRAHYVMFNTECYLSEPGHLGYPDYQTEWLKNDLAKANEERDIRPWLIVMSHHPLYCSVNWREPLDARHDESNWDGPHLKSNSDCGIDTQTLIPWLEDVFYDAGVDIYFQAHVHNYERDTAIYKNLTVDSEKDEQNMSFNAKAPIYIVTGNAGNHEGHNDLISPTPQLWERFESNDYGVGKFTVFNQTHVYWEYVSSFSEEVIDHLWLIKDRPRYNSTLKATTSS